MVREMSSKLEPGAPEEQEAPSFKKLLRLTLVALGVVYGDLGTNTLFVMKTCFFGKDAVATNPANVLGVVSLIFWSMILIVCIKYAVFVMQCDNRGEGGVMAQMSLVYPSGRDLPKRRWILVLVGLFGASLLYGDCTVTGAISVLSAVEGLDVATKFFQPYIVYITVVILFLLFLFQRKGTEVVGFTFGPVMLTWLIVIAILGVKEIISNPAVLAALNPLHGFNFFLANGWKGFILLGIVFLSVAGAEAMYADLGHLGAAPIRLGWFSVVMPALICTYFGQGALLMTNPGAAHNPFYMMAPSWALYPLVVLATAATVIASQAVISGCFSMTLQGVQLGFFPRMRIKHTSAKQVGQVYISTVNWLMMIATLGLVVGFQQSTALANAYGLAVSGTMIVTSILLAVIMFELWGWNKIMAAGVGVFFMILATAYFTSNLVKVLEGGWFPLGVGILVFIITSTWRKGRDLLRGVFKNRQLSVDKYMEDFRENPPSRIPGTAIYLTGSTSGIPGAFLLQIEHYKVVHERVIFLTLITESLPYVNGEDRIEQQEIGEGFYRIISREGYMEDRNIGDVFQLLKDKGLMEIDPDDATFLVGRANVIPDGFRMNLVRSHIFALIDLLALPVTEYIKIPAKQVVELGAFVEV
jgi:KUP system potassium uptake protein